MAFYLNRIRKIHRWVLMIVDENRGTIVQLARLLLTKGLMFANQQSCETSLLATADACLMASNEHRAHQTLVRWSQAVGNVTEWRRQGCPSTKLWDKHLWDISITQRCITMITLWDDLGCAKYGLSYQKWIYVVLHDYLECSMLRIKTCLITELHTSALIR